MERWELESQKQAVKKCHDKMKGICIRITPQEKDSIDAHLESTGEGLTAFLMRAVATQIEIDNNRRVGSNTPTP